MGRANDTVMRWGYLRDYPYAARPWYATNQILSLMIICIENVYIQDYILLHLMTCMGVVWPKFWPDLEKNMLSKNKGLFSPSFYFFRHISIFLTKMSKLLK